MWKLLLRIKLRALGVRIKFSETAISLQKRTDCSIEEILLPKNGMSMVLEIGTYFNHYFQSVEASRQIEEHKVVDFSLGRMHEVRNFCLPSIYFPSISEPINTSNLYMDIVQIEDHFTIFDLGAYAGISSISFALRAQKVVAVEPDPINFYALEKNVKAYEELGNPNISILQAAVSNCTGKALFASSGNMMSALYGLDSILNQEQAHKQFVNTVTLSDLVEIFQVSKVDFIKADIEGSEVLTFSDSVFFKNHNPTVLVEPIRRFGKNGSNSIIQLMNSYGYTFKWCEDSNSRESLLLFTRQ
jgi:FkbM family methyltransferase